MRRREFLKAAGLIGGSAAVTRRAVAQGAAGYPSKPVTLIVPWPAGGPTDVALRALAEVAAKHLGQPIVIDNKAGASGTLGPAAMAATARPDGYTIAQLPITVYRVPLMQKASWDPLKDFTYILHLTGYAFATLCKGNAPYKTWADVVADAKSRPGEITYGTPGAATTLHIGMEQIAHHSGIKLRQVPFKGATEVAAALIGGHTTLAASGAGQPGLIASGDMRLLSFWTAERSKHYPDVPTLKDLGMPYVFESPFGLAGPKGMDPSIVAKLHNAFKKALEDEVVVSTFDKFDMVPRYKSATDYTAYVRQLIDEETVALDRLGLLKKG